MSNHVYINDDDGNSINPATLENQEILINEALKSTAVTSANWGTELITLDGSGNGAVIVGNICRECWIVFPGSSAMYLAVKNEGNATANDFRLPTVTKIVRLPIRNTSQLKFFGTAGNLVTILWRD